MAKKAKKANQNEVRSKFGWVIQEEMETRFNANQFNAVDELLEMIDYTDFYNDPESGISIGFFIDIPWTVLITYKNKVVCNLYLFYPRAEGTIMDQTVVDRAINRIKGRFTIRMQKLLAEIEQ